MTLCMQDLTVFGPLHCPKDPVYVPQQFTLQLLAELCLPEGAQQQLAVLGQQLPPAVQAALRGFTFTVGRTCMHAARSI